MKQMGFRSLASSRRSATRTWPPTWRPSSSPPPRSSSSRSAMSSLSPERTSSPPAAPPGTSSPPSSRKRRAASTTTSSPSSAPTAPASSPSLTQYARGSSRSSTFAYFLKIKGDYYRYLAEFKVSNERKEAADATMEAYKAAQLEAMNLDAKLDKC